MPRRCATDDQYLERLRSYYKAHRVFPPFARLSELLGFASTASAFALVDRFIEAGYLHRTAERRISPGPRFFERVIVASAHAGNPRPFPNDAPEVISIDDHLIDDPNRTVLIRVRGDSMSGVAIRDGDLVVVERAAPASPGDIVVAVVDGELTVKTLVRDDAGAHFLRPENPAYPEIRPRGSLELFGRVTGLVRRYRS